VERPAEPDLLTTVDLVPSATPVRAIMSPGVIAISSETTVSACAATMTARRTHAVLVIDHQTRNPVGWVFHSDILGHLRRDPLTTRAADVVSEEASYIHPEDTVEEAAERMATDHLTHVLVGHGPEAIPEGVLSSWDLVAFYARRAGP
jgi:CBS-domain-containing membrane protein